ncbi:TonB-dependent receptor [Terriglobus tenax]|uniref:TonB-dependent receptor n=1 Tax=Terriglobus tenax TaxID=1111115 RepID=UPI0021E0C21C|nr:TonB-dependent receptor [Terriglobus tenax]
MRLLFRIVCGLLLCFSLVSAPAQSHDSGQIHLVVKDTAGLGLAVTGTLTGPGAIQQFQTSVGGEHTFTGLAFGNYRLQLYRNGFATQTTVIDVRSSDVVESAITLTLSSLSTSITVFSQTPIGQADTDTSTVPIPVQTVSAQQLADVNALNLGDGLNKRVNGIYVNENQGNPFQMDVNYRGYTASPLLGTPQGLSVYMDGVRQNQPFGDVVSWDLIPQVAIQDMELIPGANPLYGLNSLGGALALRTKDGISNAGLTVKATGGSFGRRAVEGEWGGFTSRGFNWYVAGNLYHEDGWRKYSPSDVKQSFAKLGWITGRTTMSLSGAYAINNLTGNGTQDFRNLNRDYSSVYTIPDQTKNHSPSLTFNVTHEVNNKLTLSGNAYYRYIRANTFNGDLNDDSFDQSLYTLSTAEKNILTANGYTGFPTGASNATQQPFPFWRCIAQGLLKDEPGEKCTGMDTYGQNKQTAYGLSGLLSYRTTRNRFAAGVSWDRSSLSYSQISQFGYLNTDGVSITTIPVFADGSTEDDGVPNDTRVNLHGKVNVPSFYATDTILLSKFTFTFSGRYNHATVDNFDRLPSSAGRGTLTAKYSYQRFNPSAGMTYRLAPQATVYFNYSEGNRAPTSTELGCADPAFPCRLPNAMVSDPPLKQVVSRTFEVGIRGKNENRLQWNAGFFRGTNYDDLLFVSSTATGFGYFTNFGRTIRQGVEAGISYQFHPFTFSTNYTFLQATYGSAQIVDGSASSANEAAEDGARGIGGNQDISAGNTLPQTPSHILKFNADYRPSRKLMINFNVLSTSGSYARGNENNQHQPDGVYYLGAGRTDAYGIANVGARYTFSSRFELFAQINNLFDTHYATAAQLGGTPFDSNGNFIGRPFASIRYEGETVYPLRHSTFLAPGAPINVFGGLRVTFQKKAPKA